MAKAGKISLIGQFKPMSCTLVYDNGDCKIDKPHTIYVGTNLKLIKVGDMYLEYDVVVTSAAGLILIGSDTFTVVEGSLDGSLNVVEYQIKQLSWYLIVKCRDMHYKSLKFVLDGFFSKANIVTPMYLSGLSMRFVGKHDISMFIGNYIKITDQDMFEFSYNNSTEGDRVYTRIIECLWCSAEYKAEEIGVEIGSVRVMKVVSVKDKWCY